MLTQEQNEILCHIGPGTPMGNVMRRYWVPALLSWELAESDCPPVTIKLLGEELVAFRQTDGKVGVVGARCAHRRGTSSGAATRRTASAASTTAGSSTATAIAY